MLFYLICPTKRHIRCLQVALNCEADVNNVSSTGTHVFQAVCEKAQGCLPMCLVLLDEGADPNAANQVRAWTQLRRHSSERESQKNKVRPTVSPQQTGVTALMEAAKAGALQLVRAILRSGGNPNTLDHRRLTAAHYAAMGGFFEVCFSGDTLPVLDDEIEAFMMLNKSN